MNKPKSSNVVLSSGAKKAPPPKTGSKDLKTPTASQKVSASKLPSATKSLARRRLSLLNSSVGSEADGATPNKFTANDEELSRSSGVSGSIVSAFAAKSRVGLVPMNPSKINQDTHFGFEKFAGDISQSYFGVADGHGVNGHDVSDLIKRKLPVYLMNDPLLKKDAVTALKNAYAKLNTDICSSSFDVSFSGSTLVSVLLRGSQAICANVGDSRAVVGRRSSGWRPVRLSEDHSPERPDEKARILAANGRVHPFTGADGNPVGPSRVWLKNQDAPGLAMSRSMGDTVAASVGVSCLPEFMTVDLIEDDKFIVIASDGVWEFMTSEDVVNFVGNYYSKGDPRIAADELVKEAQRRWRREEEVIDDTTCVIIYLSSP